MKILWVVIFAVWLLGDEATKLYNDANRAYQQGHYPQALALYSSVRSNDANLMASLYFNMGNAFAKQKAYQNAIKSYEKSLQLRYDEDALYNIALLKSLQEPTTKPKNKKTNPSNTQSQGAGANSSMLDAEVSRAQNKQPLGYNFYQNLNKAGVNEKNPW